MSKPLNNYLLPTLGGIGVVLGLGYGAANRGYGQNEIAVLQDRNAQVEASVASMSDRASAAENAARVQAAKVVELSAELEAVKAEADKASEASRAAQASAKAEVEARIAAAQAKAARAEAISLQETAGAAVTDELSEEAGSAFTGSSEGAGKAASVAASKEGGYGLGRAATENEVAAWDLDVSPDGTGLPKGRGDVFTGEEVFAEKCAVCHGDFAEGRGNWPKLAGGGGTLADKDPLKTVGSYWPYLSTVWDYVHRSMPFGDAQSLSSDEVYAIVAYILYSNDLVDDEFELSHENFRDFEMPNKGGFIIDDRAGAEAHFIREPCMTGCKASVEITMRAAVLDVTPEEEGAAEVDATAEEPAAAVAALDTELVKAGEKVFKKCKACHQVGDNAKNKTGPVLNGLMRRQLGSVDGFKYSKTMVSMGEGGLVWEEGNLAEYLTKPKAYVPKTKMSFAGLKKEKDILAVTEYLKSFSQ